jgi:plastocyanin
MAHGLLTPVAASGFVVVLAACGSSSTSVANTSTSPSPISSPSPSSPPCPGSAPAGGGATVTIEARDYCFDPSALNLVAGRKVTVMLVNKGTKEHNLSIGGTDVGEAQPGNTATLTYTPATAGNVQFFCKYHKDSNGMVGTATVTGTTGAAPAKPPSPNQTNKPNTKPNPGGGGITNPQPYNPQPYKPY